MGARANLGFMNCVMVELSAMTCALFTSGKFAAGVPSCPGDTTVCGVVLKFIDVFSTGDGEGPCIELCLSDLLPIIIRNLSHATPPPE